MKIDAVGPDLGQQVNNLYGRQWSAHRLAKWVTADIAHSPQAESEPVLRLR
jgi:hypothetical protein